MNEMNEQTTKLIEQLAAKLGTTAEHLWEVLVRQAPISAATDICISAVIVFLLCKSLGFVQRKTRETDDACAEWEEEGACVAWFVWGSAAIIGTLMVLCSMEGVVAGFLNPEYWALKQIIK